MAKLSFDDGDGVWRTIGGRRVFIREGESLSSAMKKSGKFKSAKRKNEVKDESKSFSKDELKENDEQNSKKTGEVKDMIEVKDGTYLPIREGETKEDVMKAYNERQKKYRANLEPEVSKNLMDPRRLWDQDLVDTYIEMNEKGMFSGKDKDKFTRDMKNMEGKPLYSPDRIKGELKETTPKSNEKYSVDYFKQRGVEIKDTVPEGYVKLEGATTAPNGYEWYSNGKSRFGGEYKNALVKTEEKSNQISNALRQKAYQKYLKEHPTSKITFNDFKDMMNYKK